MKQLTKFLLVLTVIAGCAHDETSVPDTGYAYFPLQKGNYQVYSVIEKHYSGTLDPVIETYELMTEVVDSFSSEGTFIYVINRSRRPSESEPWAPMDTWSARKNAREGIVSEGNTPFVKVVFPIREGTVWNGNIFNTLGTDEYVLTNVAHPFQVSGMTFDNTVSVEQEQNKDFIVFNDSRREVYAMDIGLVYREITQLNYCTQDHCLGQQKITSGIQMVQEIKAYGKL